MRRFIVTGAPGAGKTTLLRHLATHGYAVVAEAATDIIALEQEQGTARPWESTMFPDKILQLQQERQALASTLPAPVVFFDRSPLDTLALCHYMGYPLPPDLKDRFRQIQEAGNYERDIFFLENLGFCEPTAARQISYEDTLRFERIHEDVYREWDYRCIKIPPLSVEGRAALLLERVLSSQ
jgi:hypothetical protein